MGLISDVVGSIGKTLTAPLRFGHAMWNVAVNSVQVVGNVITGDKAALAHNLGELKDSAKKAVFSGVESAFLLGGFGLAAAAKGVGMAAAKQVGVKMAVSSTATTTLKHASNFAFGTAFVTGYAEQKIRG